MRNLEALAPWVVSLPVAALLFAAFGCASKGPKEDKPPTVEVTQLNSTVITPQLVKFQAKILIRNRNKSSLDFERVDYAVDLRDRELFASSFDGMKRTSGKGQQTVTFPFQIAMGDILDQTVAILAEEGMRVTFRGTVFPDAGSGYAPMPFQDTATIPIPRIPKVAFAGAEGVPLGDGFVVKLRVNNTNDFPLSVSSVDSYLELNKVKYQLLHTDEETDIEPGTWGTVALRMENSTSKTLSVVLNTVLSPETEFSVGGTIECGSPYGWIVIPFVVMKGS